MSLQSLFLLFFLSHVLAYNLDVRNAYFFKDPESPRKSYFGFATALYPPGKKIGQVLVGAPRANVTSSDFKSIVEPGIVYFCSIRFENMSTVCSKVVLDRNTIPSRESAWFGAFIKVENSTTSKIVITAPNWKRALYFSNYGKYPILEGSSYSIIIKDDDGHYKNHQYFPMPKSSNRDHFLYGFSAYLISESGDVIVGAPGDENCMLITKDELIIFNKTDFFREYFGYSVTSGYFYNRKERLYAGGVPRASSIFGQVVIFQIQLGDSNSMFFKKILYGEQMGEYFGSSLASCDINNDGRDDLIVGAPLWSDEGDEGCVYVYLSKDQTDFGSQRICGSQVNGRFGTTITCLGDLDYDGCFDVAVGAPYEDSGRGAVYVLNGAADGQLVLSQRVAAADLPESLRGFGMSVSEPRDLDGDLYADVAVGAYLSGHVVLLMGRPVVTLSLELLRPRNFTLKTDTSEFGAEVCVRYDGAFGPDFIRVLLTLGIDEFHKRAIVNQTGSVNNNVYTFVTPLNKKELKCIPVKMLLIENIQNILDPIEITGNASIEEEPSCMKCPVLNPRSKAADNLKQAFFLDCGSDNLCISDLRVNVTSDLSQNSYIIGSRSNVNLTVVVENRGELAHRAEVHIYIPQQIALARMPPECNQQSEVNQTIVVICSIGNPLRLYNSLTLELDLNAAEYTSNFTEIRVIAATISQLEDSSYNNASLIINYSIDADVAMLGRSNGTLLWYSENDVSDPHLKKVKFRHIYEILKFGLTPIKEVAVAVNVPIRWKNNTITKINQIESFIDGRRYDCEHIKSENFTIDTLQNSFYEVNDSTVIPPDNRTFYVNCSNMDVTCQTLYCKLGPLRKPQSVAKLSILITFQLSSSTAEATRGKDIIFFTTDGHVEIIQPNVELLSSRPHSKQIATTIFNHFEPHKVEMWIIVASVLFGIILLALLTLLLYKLGFFNRARKENLQNLRANAKLVEERLMTDHESHDEQK